MTGSDSRRGLLLHPSDMEIFTRLDCSENSVRSQEEIGKPSFRITKSFIRMTVVLVCLCSMIQPAGNSTPTAADILDCQRVMDEGNNYMVYTGNKQRFPKSELCVIWTHLTCGTAYTLSVMNHIFDAKTSQ